MIEGGPNTVKTVLKSIQNNIPCIFIDKSGRFSDIVSFIYEALMHNEEEGEDEKKDQLLVREEIVQEIHKETSNSSLKK